MAVDSRSPGQFVNNCPISLEPTAIITHENAIAFSYIFLRDTRVALYFFFLKKVTRSPTPLTPPRNS